MKVNIKNARRLETELDNEISRLTGKVRHGRSSHSTYAESVAITENSVDTLVASIGKMKQIRMDIRTKIGKFNAESGINDLTASIADAASNAEIQEMIYNLSSPTSTRDYGTDSVKYTSGVSEAYREAAHTKLLVIKREIQRLKDKCQGVNSSGTIELDSDTESFLKVSGLMD